MSLGRVSRGNCKGVHRVFIRGCCACRVTSAFPRPLTHPLTPLLPSGRDSPVQPGASLLSEGGMRIPRAPSTLGTKKNPRAGFVPAFLFVHVLLLFFFLFFVCFPATAVAMDASPPLAAAAIGAGTAGMIVGGLLAAGVGGLLAVAAGAGAQGGGGGEVGAASSSSSSSSAAAAAAFATSEAELDGRGGIEPLEDVIGEAEADAEAVAEGKHMAPFSCTLMWVCPLFLAFLAFLAFLSSSSRYCG